MKKRNITLCLFVTQTLRINSITVHNNQMNLVLTLIGAEDGNLLASLSKV